MDHFVGVCEGGGRAIVTPGSIERDEWSTSLVFYPAQAIVSGPLLCFFVGVGHRDGNLKGGIEKKGAVTNFASNRNPLFESSEAPKIGLQGYSKGNLPR